MGPLGKLGKLIGYAGDETPAYASTISLDELSVRLKKLCLPLRGEEEEPQSAPTRSNRRSAFPIRSFPSYESDPLGNATDMVGRQEATSAYSQRPTYSRTPRTAVHRGNYRENPGYGSRVATHFQGMPLLNEYVLL